jgi:hypothetical protein
MSDFPDLVAPYTRVPLVHDTTDLFDPETMTALDARYAATGAVVDATTTVKGIIEIATTGEATTGTDTTRAVTAAGVAAVLAAFAPGISKIEPITRTAYDLLSPPVSTTLYVIDEAS